MERYTRTAIFLHWLIALLIVCTFVLGLVMTSIPGLTPTKLRYFSYHKSLGVTIFVLVCLRLLWRLNHSPPLLPTSIARIERDLAAIVHSALYVLMFAVPVSGYFYSLAAGVPVKYLGMIPLPVFIEPNPGLKPILKSVHFWLNMSMVACLALHVLGTMKHRIIDKENLLKRMLP